MEDVAQSAGTECQVQSCDHIFGFNNANNIADLAAQIDNVKLNSVLDHYAGPARGGSGIPIYLISSPWDTNIP